MPGGDRTGPGGYGPMSGRGAGLCAGSPVPGFMNPGWGRGGGRGFRGGRGGGGWRHRYGYDATALPGWRRGSMAAPPSAAPSAPPFVPLSGEGLMQGLEQLKSRAKYVAQELEDLRSRIREVESSMEDSKAK